MLIKRVLDCVAAAVGLVLLCPLFVLAAVAIRLDSPGPIFYRATRVGRNGQLFGMYKFRTMVDGPASDGPRVTARDDPRVTRLGRFLRNTKMNELPQLINVLKGEMSLVGPRPEDPDFVAHYSPEERRVFSVRPGITSPAAILYRDEEAMLSHHDAAYSYLRDILPSKLRLDLLYVQRRSFLLDLDVLLRTLMVLIPLLRREATQAAGIFLGPIQRLVREQLPWFLLDSATAFGAVATAGLIWRASQPLDQGWGRALLVGLGLAVAFSLSNRLLGLQRTAWRYASAQEALDIVFSTGLATFLLTGGTRVVSSPLPAGMLLLAGFFALAGFVATRYRSRLLAGLWNRCASLLRTCPDGRERVLVVGGGEAGQLMLWMLQNGAGAQAFQVVGVIDDDLWKQGARIHRVRVLGDRTRIPDLVKEHDVGLIVFAIHNIDPARQNAILEACRATPARVVVMPNFVALLAHEARASDPNGLRDTEQDRPAAGSGRAGRARPWEGVSGEGRVPVDSEVLARWLGDLADLAGEGRLADVKAQLHQMRAVLQMPPQPHAKGRADPVPAAHSMAAQTEA